MLTAIARPSTFNVITPGYCDEFIFFVTLLYVYWLRY